jgi:hypothetical protein
MKSTVYFYCPSEKIVRGVPNRAEDYWAWINQVLPNDAILLSDGLKCTWDGPYSWTIQTYMNLRQAGLGCELLSEIPPSGIVISHSDFWPPNAYPKRKQFFVEIKPDRGKKLHTPQFTICQSQYDPIFDDPTLKVSHAAVIGYWPQPGLIRRANTRGRLIRTAAFMGNRENFLSQKDLLASELAKRNIMFRFPPRSQWNDYSDIDLVVAVRDQSSFLPSAKVHKRVERKPPNKLINAWLARVPAILSPEPSYLLLKKSRLDFLDASDINEILKAVDELISSPELYQKIVQNAEMRAADYGIDSVVEQWKNLIDKRLDPLYRQWQAKPLARIFHRAMMRIMD